MRDYKQLEQLIKSCLDRYKEGFNEVNTEFEIDFQTTCTTHAVEVQGVNAWVAYLRLSKMTKPKGGTDDEIEELLIYNNAYKFKNIGERTDPNAPWKYVLYLDLAERLMQGGIEYAELLRRAQQFSKGNAGKPISNIVQPEKPEIIVTDQMPAPLSTDEKQYLEWVKRNHQKE